MRVHMGGAILRIVFKDEDGRVLPIGAGRNFLNEKAKSVVIVGDVELRCRHARAEAVGLIIGKIYDIERRKRIGSTVPLPFDIASEFLYPIRDAEITTESWIGIGSGD